MESLKKTYTISLDIGVAESARTKEAIEAEERDEKPNFSGLVQRLLKKYIEETT